MIPTKSLFATMAAFLILASCAGTPRTAVSADEAVKVDLSSDEEIKDAYGYSYTVNPFLSPPGILTGGKNTFLVVRFSAGETTEVEIAGVELEGEAGRLETRTLGKEELRRFWEFRGSEGGGPVTEAKIDRRTAILDRYAMDLGTPNRLRGGSPYSIVVLGPSREEIGSAELIVRYFVNGQYREQVLPVNFSRR